MSVSFLGWADARILAQELTWTRWPSLPDPLGFAGSFAGVADDGLLVAGGANFPDGLPHEGGRKVWYDGVFRLDSPTGRWRRVGKLPRACGYGVSITVSQGVACLGGGDRDRCHAECFLLHWEKGALRTTPLPALPKPRANGCGARIGSKIYLAGGVEHPLDVRAQKTFWKLDLERLEDGWQTLEPWPGPERMLATAAALDGSFFLLSGVSLHSGPDGKPVRDWLRDGYRYTPGGGWSRIADLPRAAVAAPSPAMTFSRTKLLIVGGDDGRQVDSPPSRHQGFSRRGLLYDVAGGVWTETGESPFGLVASPGCFWKGCYVVAGGETRPGVRSTEVWAGRWPPSK